MTSFRDQTLALASMFQSAYLINQLAHGEGVNQAAFDCGLDSLFTLDATSIEDIYGPGDGLIQGLKTLKNYLGTDGEQLNKLIVYYVMSMIKLETRLTRDEAKVEAVQHGLNNIEQQVKDFDLSQSGKVHKIDGLYQDTISQLKPRIIVQGEQSQLSQSDTTSKVRTLLFAGIRAAVLWKQLGGSRFKLLFNRKKYVEQAQQLLLMFNS